MQEMKGKEGSGDPEGREAKRGLASSGRRLDTSGEKAFFADVWCSLALLDLESLSAVSGMNVPGSCCSLCSREGALVGV